MQVKNILIVKLSAIGDVIHTLPALNAIRKQYPDSVITWLVEEAASDFVIEHNALNRVIISKRKKWIKDLISLSFFTGIKEIYYFIKKLRDTNYDLVIDFQTLLKSGILVCLSKGKRKTGYGRGMEHMEYSYLFLNDRIAPVNMNNHALLRNLMLIEAIGIRHDEICYNLPVVHRDREMAIDLLKQHDRYGVKSLVAINPMAKWKTKLWDELKFAQLADRLIEEKKVGVLFTGGTEDRKTITNIISLMKKNAINLAGKTSLKVLSAILEQVDILVTTDTGPMHVAAAVGTPVIALFGPTAPWRTGPFGPNHSVIRTGLECSPCFKRECKTIECMKRISVDNVFEASAKALEKI